MRIFLTGTSGFIGSHVARALLRRNHEVYALVRESSNLWRIPDIISSLRLIQSDLLSRTKLDALLTQIRPQICLHLAWYAEPGLYLSANENLDHVFASVRLALRLSELGCERLVATGTCFEYDTTYGYLSENTPTKPRSLYAASKLSLLLLLEQISVSRKMDVAWARLFYQYGPSEDRRRLVPSVILPLLHNREAKVTEGQQVRDFLHIEDVAEAICALAESRITGAANVGSGRPVTVESVVRLVGKIINRPELIKLGALEGDPNDPPFICADNHKLRESTAWIPRHTLEDGLRQTITWWQTHLDGENRTS